MVQNFKTIISILFFTVNYAFFLLKFNNIEVKFINNNREKIFNGI